VIDTVLLIITIATKRIGRFEQIQIIFNLRKVQYLPIGETKETNALISSGWETSSYSSAWDDANDHQKGDITFPPIFTNITGETSQCFYDSTDYSAVRWTFPNPKPAFIMMVVCLPIFGALWIGVLGYWIGRKILKNRSEAYHMYSERD
jgi:hypothetical protein